MQSLLTKLEIYLPPKNFEIYFVCNYAEEFNPFISKLS
jgi:hypothetical protein